MPVKKQKEKLLVPREKYLSAGVHIGMTFKTAGMKRFIYKIRPNGLAVLNIGLLDKRIEYAANMIANSNSTLIISRKEVGWEPAKKFAESIGGRYMTGRFMPGSLTNPAFEDFFEPDLVIVVDPSVDRQAIKEAVSMRIPVIALTDTYNDIAYIDLILPSNNKGKKSIALVLWAIAREVAKLKKAEFTAKTEDFGGGEYAEPTGERVAWATQ
ncbi:MAG: 30S ribosomal protein S2 [Candidatus Aenigmarchaeota archaeon]|nr:30S ribosomal protein S2 [Candidatus Aenigmarchaeota archaeon]